MTSIYQAGAENPSHLEILASCGAQRVAVNVASLMRRKTSSWELALPYHGWSWVAYSDGPSSENDLLEVLMRAAIPPDFIIGPDTWKDVSCYLPLWNGEKDFPDERENGLVVTDRVFKDKELSRRARGSKSLGTTLGVITGSIDTSIGKYDLVISGSWWSVMKYGETQVWDGKKMHRYNADRKSEVRTRHMADIEALGIDPEQVLLQNPDEVARLAISSWQCFEESLSNASVLPFNKKVEVNNDQKSMSEFSGSGDKSIDIGPPKGRHKSVLPVMGMSSITATEKYGDGTEIIEEQAIIRAVPDSIRQCNNCFLATSGCPAYEPNQSCAYSIPVEIRSKDQLQSVLQAMIEMQTQRVLQARFAEEITGQELSTEVGRELDRLFTSVEKMRDIMDNRDTVKVTMEARGRAGVLSRLFGDRVGTNAKMLSQPMDSDDVIDAVVDEDQ